VSPLPVVQGGIAAALLLLLGWQPWRRGADRPIGPLASALAAPAAVLTTLYANASRLGLPPRKYLDWVLLAGLASVLLVALRGRRRGLAFALFAAGAAVLAYVPTGSLHARYWGSMLWYWVAGLTAAFALLHFVAERALAARRADGAAALAIAALGAAPALGLSGTGAGALLVASLGGSAVLVSALALVRRDLAPGSGFAAPFAALFAGLVASGVLYAETPRWSGLALLAAPALVLLPGAGARMRLARLALIAAVVAAAAWLSRGGSVPNPYG